MITLAAASAPVGQPGGPWFVVFVCLATAVGGGSGLAALLLITSQRRKNNAEAHKSNNDSAHVLTSAAVGLVKPLEERLQRTEDDNRDLRSTVDRQERRGRQQDTEISRLRRDMRSLRDLLVRITEAVTSSTSTADPAATVSVVRDMVANVDHPHVTDR